MRLYFARFGPGLSFTAGVGWIDLTGRQRATSDANGPFRASLADRSYFKDAIATRKPVVGEAIVAQRTKRRLIVMGVPTRDARGRLSGVLAGGIVLEQSSSDARGNDLGYGGLQVIDRAGQQVTRRNLEKPENAALIGRLTESKEGVLVDTAGLDGSSGRVVAYATAATPGWTTVLDQPTGVVSRTPERRSCARRFWSARPPASSSCSSAGPCGARVASFAPAARRSRGGRS